MIFILSESDAKLAAVPDLPTFRKVNLNTLDVGEYQINALAENRIYLSNLVETPTNIIGFASARWNEKYPHRIEALANLTPNDNQVFVADLTDADWARQSDRNHPGIYELLKEMADYAELRLASGNSFYANNYVCTGKVFREFLPFWRRVFHYFYAKYGVAPPYRNLWPGYNPDLHPAYLFERITMLYFANRKDLLLIGL